MAQTFYVCLFASFIIAPFAFSQWQPVDFKTLNILALLAALGVANVTSIFLAYSFAPMMVVSPFSYARLVFTALLTAFVSHQNPSIHVFIGSAVIMSVNFYFAYKHKK